MEPISTAISAYSIACFILSIACFLFSVVKIPKITGVNVSVDIFISDKETAFAIVSKCIVSPFIRVPKAMIESNFFEWISDFTA